MATAPLPKWSGENMENAMTCTAGFAEQITNGWGKTNKPGVTGPHRSAKGRLDPQPLHWEETKTHNLPRSERCLRWMRSTNVSVPRHCTHSHLWNTGQLQGVLDQVPRIKKLKCFSTHSSSLPPYGDWENYSQLKYHHMLRYELTKTYYSFTSQNGRSTHRKICL